MTQFDIYRVRGGGLVVDCQADLLRSLPTRFVAPLRARDDSAMQRLTPILEVDGKEFMMVTQLTGAINVRDIEETVTSLVEQEYLIKSAIDMLITGF